MNYARMAFLGATVAYFVLGFILFAALPAIKAEFLRYPGVYRPQEAMMKLMSCNTMGILVSFLVVTILYATIHPASVSLPKGLAFGGLNGLFAVCAYTIHNYTLLNISLTLTFSPYDALTYFLQWLIADAAISLIYKPS